MRGTCKLAGIARMAKCREYHMSTNGNTRVAIRAYDVHISQHAVRPDDFKTLSGNRKFLSYGCISRLGDKKYPNKPVI